MPVGVERGLAHLGRRVLQVLDLRRTRGDVGLRHGERPPETAVEPLREIAGELDVLPLVLADRHAVGLVEQDVRGLQDRVGEQAHAGPVAAVPCGLVLELRHPARLAEPRDAAQHPLQLGVLGHVRLDEHRAPRRIQPQREELGDAVAGARRERLRVVLDGERVQVGDEVERVVVVLHGHPLPHRTEVVAEMERVRGGLDAGEHPRASLGSHGPILPGGIDRAAIGCACGGDHGRPGSRGPLVPRRRSTGPPRARAVVQRPAVGPGGAPPRRASRRGGRPARPRPLRPGARRRAGCHPGRRPRPRRRCATTSAGARRSSQVSRGAATWCSSSRRIGRCTGSRWSTGGGCSSPTASPRSTTRGPSWRRRRSTGSPPRPSAPGSTRRIPGGRTRRSRPRWATWRSTSTARCRHGSPANDTARSSTACSRTARRSLYAQVECPALLLVAGAGNPAASAAAAAIPHAELVAFPGGDHDLHAQHPEEVAALIGRLA